MISEDDSLKVRDLVIHGVVDDLMADSLLREFQTGGYRNDTHLRLFLNSSGGSMSIAMAIARILLSSFRRISTYNLSKVDSAAIIIFLAGSARYCCPTAGFLFHAPKIQLNGSYNQRELMEYMALLQSDSEVMARYYHERAGILPEALQNYMKEQTNFDCSMALQTGLATGVCENPQFNNPRYLYAVRNQQM
ncbi:MAG: ATP-dependent Clp protease proteolytic subunit [Akkermansia sp.]|nr:ATP-dependent Clp protease proteolytic subunit [Akkermansia sp.]MEE1266663.1 ATP-dependent Clp protease proteolytic subunit [Akkermansia sp.]